MIQQYTPDREVRAALDMQSAQLQAAVWELVAAVSLLLVALFSLLLAVLRLVWAGLGFCLWVVALVVRLVSWCHLQAMARKEAAWKPPLL